MGENFATIFQQFCEYFSQSNVDEIPLVKQLEFTKIINKLGAICEQVEQENQAEIVYKKGLEFMPFNVYILNILGSFMFRLGDVEGAQYYLRKAIKDNYYLPARKNLLHVIWHQIPRWHYRMMNDSVRNTKYQNAIINAISQGAKNVYDIGAGCGLLSMISHKNGADKVTAFEENSILFNLANEILSGNEIKIDLINESSVKFAKGYYNKCDLIVSEIFDCALFGEGCIESLHHAISTFPSEGYKIIPSGANCYLLGLESEKLRLHYYLSRNVDELNLSLDEIIVCSRINSYDAQDVFSLIKNKDATVILQEKLFFAVDFNKKMLQKFLNDFVFDDFDLIANFDGNLDVLVFYFDLKLDDNNKITTDPSCSKRCNCWENAVFPLDQPIKVVKGQKITICAKLENNQLNFVVKNNHKQEMFKVSKEIVRILNDKKLCDFIYSIYTNGFSSNRKILDVNIMPFFGFIAAKNNTVFCLYENENDLKFFDYLTNKNNLKILFIEQKSSDLSCVQDKVDYIFDDFIDGDGSWKGSFCDNLKTIPIKIQLHCQLIYSDYLNFCNKIDDVNVFNFKIASYLEKYKGDEHPNLENRYDFIKKSEVIIFDFTDSFNYDGVVRVEKEGKINAILYWFSFNETYSTLNSVYYSVAAKLLSDLLVPENGVVVVHIEKLFDHFIIDCKLD